MRESSLCYFRLSREASEGKQLDCEPGGSAVMVSVSSGSNVEVRVTGPSFLLLRQAGKASEGEGQTVGWKDEDMERVKGNSTRATFSVFTCLETHTHTHIHTHAHTRLSVACNEVSTKRKQRESAPPSPW